ncbi:MAG TPA: hypothetical protein VFT69_10900 [Pseudolabrys sp.]|jgi:ornithine cyclodeaminase/alanine dehydrogenase-like protein (mu-crystallin family)|nr:hypothetical protein [Pseudolabrys sp.]
MKKIEPVVLNAAEIERAAPSRGRIIAAIEDVYRMMGKGETEVPAKIGVHPDRTGSFLHAMPAWVSGGRCLGMKWVSYFPGNFSLDRPDSTGIIVLNDPDEGLPVAIMEGMWITYARTAACAAVAAKHLASPRPRRLGLVGCGGLGRWSLLMLAEVFPELDEIYVSSRTPQSRAQFCEQMAEHGRWKLVPVENAREAMTGMDIVISSVPGTKPYPIIGEWWTPGCVFIPLDVTGSWDDTLFSRVDRIVTDGHESFARVIERSRPNLSPLQKPWTPIWDVISGGMPDRGDKYRIMSIVSGVASTDMVLGWEIYLRAVEMGLGHRVQLT